MDLSGHKIQPIFKARSILGWERLLSMRQQSQDPNTTSPYPPWKKWFLDSTAWPIQFLAEPEFVRYISQGVSSGVSSKTLRPTIFSRPLYCHKQAPTWILKGASRVFSFHCNRPWDSDKTQHVSIFSTHSRATGSDWPMHHVRGHSTSGPEEAARPAQLKEVMVTAGEGVISRKGIENRPQPLTKSHWGHKEALQVQCLWGDY